MNLLSDLLGRSPAIGALRDQVERLVAGRPPGQRIPPVLLRGETGTGKGLVARLLHRSGPRADGPFVDVNCAAIPETLLEAEMFGWERGAFTDARQAKPGLFQTAHRGTIFLDEIGLLPEALQGKLLKVIEERSVRRLGSTRSEPIDVCIVAATSATADATKLREDLYHRLAVVTLHLPPLRDRGDDVIRLADAFLARACADYDLPARALTADAYEALRAYAWPGNVRELMNVMERVALLSTGRSVGAEDLGLPVRATALRTAERPRTGAGDDGPSAERLRDALRETGWNVLRTAAVLGTTRSAIRYRIKKLGLRRDEPPSPERAATATPALDAVAPASLAWQWRQVTLLRATLGAPNDLTSPAITAPIVRELLEKAHGFGGRVEEVGARGLAVAFGFDGAEDAAGRAAHAALAMRKALGRRAEAASDGVPVRIAIHAGRFQTAQLGTTPVIDLDDRRAAAALLDALVADGEANVIRVSAAVAPLLERRFHLAPAPDVDGRRSWRLTGHDGAGFALGGRITPYVGRRGEREMLTTRLAQARAGRGQVVAVAGDPGLGKSRLVFEFHQALAPDSTTCLEGRGVSYGGGAAYHPILDLVRGACGVVEDDSPAAITDKLRDRLASLGMSEDVLPVLLNLLSLPFEPGTLAGVAPDVLKVRTFEVLRELLVGVAARGPAVLIVEDLQWIDGMSEEFLATLVDAVPTAPLLLVVTYRSGYRPRWLDRSFVSQLALAPLSPDESRELLAGMLAGGAVPPAAALIVARAEGNPFYLEELVHALAETGPPASDAVPDTIHGVLRARIDTLGAEDRRVLQGAAAIGRDFGAALLERATALPAPALTASVERLRAAEFVYPTGLGAERRFRFKHALTHDVAYSTLEADERRALHARIVDAIERDHASRIDEHIESLARHAVRAEHWEKAARYLQRAGERALRRSANAEAEAALEEAAAICERLVERRAFAEAAIDVRFLLQLALFSLGQHSRIGTLMREAEARAAGLGDRAREARAAGCLATHYYVVGDHAEGLRAGRRGLVLAEALGDEGTRIGLLIRLGHAHHARGEFTEAIAVLERAIGLLDAGSPYEQQMLNAIPSVQARTWLVWCLADIGADGEALATAARARETAEKRDHPYSRVMAGWGLGYTHLMGGRVGDAVAVLEDSLALCRTWSNVHWMPRVAGALGHAHVKAGRVEAGITLLEAATTGAARIGLRACTPLLIGWLAEGYARAGRRREAHETAQRALDAARAQGERGCEAAALLVLAEAGDDAAHARAAVERAAVLGMEPLLARARTVAGRASPVNTPDA